ncbi:hypothetical protein EalM132_00192 [Exiguobacterium phage vB_EalM-132]|nr:hypothetical protein EalM132_00022 [Exiguobacterium phage vB_EalM-132]AYP68704.1 hypothetical protein EalM132_00192 [Exiguobacterium phage vB_EalM-132]
MAINKKMMETYWHNRTTADSCNKALKVARSKHAPEETIQQLINMRKSAKEILGDLAGKMAKAINKDINYQEIRDGWYAIRTITPSNESKVSVLCLTAEGLDLIRRVEGERDLLTPDLSTLTEGYLNKPLLDQHTVSMGNIAVDVLRQLGIHVDSENLIPEKLVVHDTPLDGYYVSSHAVERWAERKLGLPKGAVADHVRMHRKDLEEQVNEGLKKAQHFYDGTDAVFYIDDDNITYVTIGNHVVTLYEQLFGFTPDINRTIAFAQLDVLKQSDVALSDAYVAYEEVNESNKKRQVELRNEIRVLESQIAELKAESKHLDTGTNVALTALKRAEETNHAEFDKLFKKFKQQQA